MRTTSAKMMLSAGAAVLLIVGVAGAAYWIFSPREPLVGVSIGERLVYYVELADDPAEQSRGLSGRQSLGENQGMLFTFPAKGRYGFWMHGMQFALDFIWIAGDRIVGAQQNVPVEPGVATPRIYYPPEDVDLVLEINAGEVARQNITVGERIEVFTEEL